MRRKVVYPFAILALLLTACGDDNDGGEGTSAAGACLTDDGDTIWTCVLFTGDYAFGARIACEHDTGSKWVRTCPEGAVGYCQHTDIHVNGSMRTYWYDHPTVDIPTQRQACETFDDNTWHTL